MQPKNNINMNIKSIITAAIGLLVSVSCSGGAKQEKIMNKEGKAIVVFFSHAGDNYAVGNIEVGNTKILAIRSVWRRISTSSTSR